MIAWAFDRAGLSFAACLAGELEPEHKMVPSAQTISIIETLRPPSRAALSALMVSLRRKAFSPRLPMQHKSALWRHFRQLFAVQQASKT